MVPRLPSLPRLCRPLPEAESEAPICAEEERGRAALSSALSSPTCAQEDFLQHRHGAVPTSCSRRERRGLTFGDLHLPAV